MNLTMEVFKIGCKYPDNFSKNEKFQKFLKVILKCVYVHDYEFQNDNILRKVYLDKLFGHINFKVNGSDYILQIFREIFPDEFSTTITRYMTKFDNTNPQDKKYVKLVYKKIENIFTYQIFDAVIQVDQGEYSDNMAEGINLTWPIALIDPRKKARILALNYLDQKLKNFEKIDKSESEKIARSLLQRLKAEDNSYILSKILKQKIWFNLLQKVREEITISEICKVLVAVGQKWSYVPEVIQSLADFIEGHVDVESVSMSRTDKLELQIQTWFNDMTKESWISDSLNCPDSFDLLGLAEEFLYDRNLLKQFVVKLQALIVVKIEKGEVEGVNGWIKWVLGLRNNNKLDQSQFGQDLIAKCLAMIQKSQKNPSNEKAYGHNDFLNGNILELLQCANTLTKPLILKQFTTSELNGTTTTKAEETSSASNEILKQKFLDEQTNKDKQSLLIKCLRLLNFGYWQDTRQNCGFIGSLITQISLEEALDKTIRPKLLEEQNLLAFKIVCINEDYKDSILKILKHFAYFLKAKKAQQENLYVSCLIQVEVENFDKISKPEILAKAILDEMQADGNKPELLSDYLIKISKSLKERSFSNKQNHLTLMLSLLKVSRQKALSINYQQILQNCFESLSENSWNKENFELLKNIYQLTSKKDKDQLKLINQFFEQYTNDSGENDGLIEFFKILENPEFVENRKNSVDSLIRLYFKFFEKSLQKVMVDFHPCDNTYCSILSFQSLSGDATAKISAKQFFMCLKQVQDLLISFDLENQKEAEILFIINLVKLSRKIFMNQFTSKNLSYERLLLKIIEICLSTLQNCKRVNIVASYKGLQLENNKNVQEIDVNFNFGASDKQLFTVYKNTKKNLILFQLEEFFNDQFLIGLKNDLYLRMRQFVRTKIQNSERDMDVGGLDKNGVKSQQKFFEDIEKISELKNSGNSGEDDEEDLIEKDENEFEGNAILELIENCCRIILWSSKLNRNDSFEIIKEALNLLMNYIKEAKNKLLEKAEIDLGYKQLPDAALYTTEDQLQLEQLESSTIYILNLAIKLIADVKGKKLQIFGDLLMVYLNFTEKLTCNGLLRHLSIFYNFRGKDIKQRQDLNPMVDGKILTITQELKYIYRIGFGEENQDYFMSLILSHYVLNNEIIASFNDDEMDNENGNKKKELISITDLSFYQVKLIQSISSTDENNSLDQLLPGKKYKREFALLNLKFIGNFSKIVKGFLDKDNQIDFKTRLLHKYILTNEFLGGTQLKGGLKSLILTQSIFQDRFLSHKDVIDSINDEFTKLFHSPSEQQNSETEQEINYESLCKDDLVQNFTSAETEQVNLYLKGERLTTKAGLTLKSKSTKNVEKAEKMHKFYKRLTNLLEMLLKKVSKVFVGELLIGAVLNIYNSQVDEILSGNYTDIDYCGLKKQIEIIIEKIPTIRTTSSFKFLIFSFLESVYKSSKNLGEAEVQYSKNYQTQNKSSERFYQSVFILQCHVYDKLPKRTEEFFEEMELLDKMIFTIKKIKNSECKSFGLLALGKFSQRRNTMFLSIVNEYQSEVFSLISKFFQSKDSNLWASILDEQKLKSNLIRATKNKSLDFGSAEKKMSYVVVENQLNALLMAVGSLGSVLAPFIPTTLLMFCMCYECGQDLQTLTKKGQDLLAKNVELRLNIDPLEMLVKLCESQHFVKAKEFLVVLSYFGKKVYSELSQQLFADRQKDLFVIIKTGLQSSLNHSSQFSELAYEEVTENWIDVFMKFVVKCSEVTLKKYFGILVKWAKLGEEDYGENESELNKKILFVKLFNHMIESLGGFGISFYSYVYEYYLGFFEDMHQKFSQAVFLGKRSRQEVEDQAGLRIKLHT